MERTSTYHLGVRDPVLEDIPRLPYTCRVVDETVRLYPTGPTLFKDARRDDVVHGYRVPADSCIGAAFALGQR